MKKLVGVLLILCLVFAVAACTTPPLKQDTAGSADNAAQKQLPVEQLLEEQLSVEQPPDISYHIGIATLGLDQSEDEYRGAEATVAKFGSVDNGGMIKWIVLPANFSEEQETVITMIGSFADDPLMKGVIVNQGILGTAAGFQKIRNAGRDDMILTCLMPQDDPNVITKVADFVVHSNDFSRGYYDILRAKEIGAQKFVHMSFARHMAYETLSRRRNVFEEACKDLGLEFVFVNVPDPTSEIGSAGAQQAVFEMMPGLVAQHGKDAAYFTTNTALHEPIIKQCMALGAMFVCQDDISPLMGYPGALGIDLSAERGNWDTIVKKIEEVVVAKGQGGRMGTWPSSFPYGGSTVLVELVMDIVEGKATGTMDEAAKTFESQSTAGTWSFYLDANTNTPIENFYVITMDVYIFGKGYSGVLDQPFPEKYFDIK
jgi:hypothetical protein